MAAGGGARTVIRPATLADAAGLARLHVASWRAACRHLLPAEVLAGLSVEERTRQWEQSLVHAPRGTLVAIRGEAVLGFATAGPSRDADAPPRRVGELYALYVDPTHWERGIGVRLWRAARQWLLVEEYAEFTLWVLEANLRARSFYERAGLVLDHGARQLIDLHGTRLPEVRYRAELS